jgi:hypothetical protein
MVEPEYSQELYLQKLKHFLKDAIDFLEAVKNSFIANKLSVSLQTSVFSIYEDISYLLDELDRNLDRDLSEAPSTLNEHLKRKRERERRTELLGENNEHDLSELLGENN